jgi:hypothetical protein
MDDRSPDWMVLRWLQAQAGPAADRMLFDSDVAKAFGWSGGEAQAALARLEQAGCLDSRVFIQPGGRSIGDLRVTRAGQELLRKQPAAAGKSRHSLFRRTFAA